MTALRVLDALMNFLVIVMGVSLLFPEFGIRAYDTALMATRTLNQRVHYGMGYHLPGTPDLTRLDARLSAMDLKRGDPIFIRIFKSELTLELWMKRQGRFVLFAQYPICFWSGNLGPKLKEGDRQAPEGFYTVARQQLNPNSSWHRSFNIGFPNLYDRAHNRTGSFLMVHGGCSSVGCYAMTNGVITEIWDLILAAMDGGQERFAVNIFPFRLTDARLEAYADHRWSDFWRTLKPGYDLFEATGLPPEVSVCGKTYAVRAAKAGNGDAPELRDACEPAEAAAQS